MAEGLLVCCGRQGWQPITILCHHGYTPLILSNSVLNYNRNKSCIFCYTLVSNVKHILCGPSQKKDLFFSTLASPDVY